MPGIESQRAYDLLGERFPGTTAKGATARVVFVPPDGQKVTASDNRAAVEKAGAELDHGTRVADVGNPFRRGR